MNSTRKFLCSLYLALFAQAVSAANIFTLFKDPDGETNWQHLANWTSGTLIIILTVMTFRQFVMARRERRANRALEEIRSVLEQRVLERTRTLDESNSKLQESNQLLEGEIEQHRETTGRLRASEAYIRDILASMPLMLIGIDEQKHVTQWNREAERITGISASKALGKYLWDAYPIITVTPSQIAQVQKNGKPITIKHSQRGQCYYDIAVYPLREEQQTDVVILIDDVTQRILAENMLVQRDKMSSMGELASSMAHDINVPLEAILRGIKDARADIGDSHEHAKELLGDAIERGRQATGVIGNLLSFANSEGEYKRSENVIDIIEHAITLAEDILSEPGGLRFRDIPIDRLYDDKLPRLSCSAAELQQVFFSLFRHAFKSLQRVDRPEHRPLIRIEVLDRYEALWIKVHHNGVGLTTIEQQYIFEPFFNKQAADDALEVDKRLSFSYFIVTEHHQGQMAVTSDVNVGTTFHVQFQLR